MNMKFAVFQLDNKSLVLNAKFDSKDEAIDHVKTGVNMVILELYE
jgi:hypothetical protein